MKLQEHFDAMKALFAEPDSTPSVNPFDKSGQLWTRDHPKRCATCGDVFYTYIPEGETWEPYRVDSEPAPGGGLRATCGHPLCKDAEMKHQDKRDPRIQMAGEFSRMPETVKVHSTPGLRKAGVR